MIKSEKDQSEKKVNINKETTISEPQSENSEWHGYKNIKESFKIVISKRYIFVNCKYKKIKLCVRETKNENNLPINILFCRYIASLSKP